MIQLAVVDLFTNGGPRRIACHRDDTGKRVLDSSELDNEVLSLLSSQLSNVFKYFKPGFLSRYEPEVKALLRLVTWKYSMCLFDSTIGQQLLQLTYKTPPGGGNGLSTRQKILYAVLTIGTHWLNDRSVDLKSRTSQFKYHQLIWKIFDIFEKLIKLASLVNFAIFLQRGCYQLLIERILGIQATFPRRQYVRQLSYEFMNRELLWHGFSEFLLFVLPLINFHKIKNSVQRMFQPLRKPDKLGERNLTECAICGLSPIGPREIGCTHVFCYYCIQSNALADSRYSCPACGFSITHVSDIKPVLVNMNIKMSNKDNT